MFRFLIVVSLLLQTFGFQIDIKDHPTSIINGDLANIVDHPYYVLIYTLVSNNSLSQCGGSIIKPDLILTAAHCIHDAPTVVLTGMTTTDDFSTAQRYKAIKTWKHPFYFDTLGAFFGSFHDIALIKLEKEITLGEEAKVIEIGEEEPEEDDKVLVVGFGKDVCDTFVPGQLLCTNPASKHLRSAILTVDNIGFGQIKTSGIDQHVCQGDSGGPMVYDGKVIGVASIADANCKIFNIYTRLSTFTNRKWIQQQIKDY